jgi:alpha-beta hydrolase superfamily lysophospholipase
MSVATLSFEQLPAQVRGVVLVMHGGRETSMAPTRPAQLAVLRMLPIARAIARAGAPHGIAVARLRFAVRGWNGASRSPVGDARDALDQLAARFSDVPIALVGHSMGGRTALNVADHPAVTTVVGLAPWIERADGTSTVAGRRVLLVHGTGDRITDPRRSKRFVQEVEGLASSASFVAVEGEKHAMLRRPAVWNALASGYVLAALCAVAPGTGQARETAGDETTNVLQLALAGQAALVV